MNTTSFKTPTAWMIMIECVKLMAEIYKAASLRDGRA